MEGGTPYAPNGDTLLLIEGISAIRQAKALEIGAGAGYVARELALRNEYVVATELDPASLRRAKEVLRGLSDRVDLVRCDRARPLRDELFDLVCFNPPYVPSESVQDLATDAGPKAEVPLAFLSEALRVLKKGGRVLFVISTATPAGPLLEAMRRFGVSLSLLDRRHLFFEDLLLVGGQK